MKYKIVIDMSNEFRRHDYRRELIYEFPTFDEAKTRFDEITDSVDAYFDVMRIVGSKRYGQIYPILLIEMQDGYEDGDMMVYGTMVDRFEPYLIFDDEFFFEENIEDNGYETIVKCGRREWVLFHDSEQAGEAAAERWRDMAKHDSKEFAYIIGEERLVQWALGESDSFGISSLDEFLEVTATVPEEEWASYDHREIEVEGWHAETIGYFDWAPGVAYRRN